MICFSSVASGNDILTPYIVVRSGVSLRDDNDDDYGRVFFVLFVCLYFRHQQECTKTQPGFYEVEYGQKKNPLNSNDPAHTLETCKKGNNH